MAFSALLDSFSSTVEQPPKRSHLQEHLQEPSRKRRKLAFASRNPTKGINEHLDGASLQSLDDALNSVSYKEHFGVDEAPKGSVATSTILHPVLGRVTVSNVQILSDCNSLDRGNPQSDESSSYKSHLCSYIRSYTDVVLANHSIPTRDDFRRLVSSHGLAHVLTTRQAVLKNSANLAKRNTNDEETNLRRDQGFTRPKVLFLLPTRNSCYEIINHMLSLAPDYICENRQRFDEEYGPGTQAKSFSDAKPEDFKTLFRGNSDDMFRIGVKLTRKTVKLFSRFYHSDLILASPLGLKSIISSAAKGGGDMDFLSSIEILYVDSADALQMQNWDHVESVMAGLNQMPKEAHDCDFSRVRSWYLNGDAAQFRQTIISTSFLFPEANSLTSKYNKNYKGLIKIHNTCLGELHPYIPQVFTRIKSTNPALDPDARFDYFTKTFMPFWKAGGVLDKGGLLIFVSSYLDSIRLRNYFIKTGQSFCEVNEYTPASEITRSRAHFLSGRQKILIYTERAHHFRRYNVKGVCNIFLYNMPANSIFYRELVGFLRGSISDGKSQLEESKVRALFTPWDALKVERIVGTVGYEEIKKNDIESMDFEFP